MTITNLTLVLATLACAALLFQPRVLASRTWRATVTPLASIIGSGFLVCGPILAHAAGRLAWLAMAGLCGAAYLFGFAVRHNIEHVEPQIEAHAPRVEAALERASNIALSLAYFVSVAYYLNLFAAFGLRLDGIVAPVWIRAAATVVIAGIGLVGVSGGLRALERLEVAAVGLKFAVIGGLFAALALGLAMAAAAGTSHWYAAAPQPRGFREIRTVLGLVVLVQGFETSRYLGDAYSTSLRVTTMRLAQWISTAIYVVFILLITPYFTDGLARNGGETAIIDMLAPLGAALAPLLILAALASQLSAAVADLNGAGGLLAESSGHRLPVRLGNLLTALAAIAVTWAADIYSIIAYASRVFVVYYALQCLQAALSAYRQRRRTRLAAFGFGVLLALAALLLAAPADV